LDDGFKRHAWRRCGAYFDHLEAAQAPKGTPMRWLLEWVRKSFLATYLKTYFQLQPLEKSSFIEWRTIMAANFYVDVSLPGEGANLLAIVGKGINSIASG
jgi:hypothetical protein